MDASKRVSDASLRRSVVDDNMSTPRIAKQQQAFSIDLNNSNNIPQCSAPKRLRATHRSIVGDFSCSPLVADSSSRLKQLIDERLHKQSENIYTHMKSLLLEFENSIVNEIDKRICDIRVELNDVVERVSRIEKVVEEVSSLKSEIKELKFQALKQENSLVACDLRINGIPYTRDENLQNLFDTICGNINIQPPTLKSIYRLQNRNNTKAQFSRDAVIIAKLKSPYDKNFFLKNLSNFKKNNNHRLTLNVAGLDSNMPFYINENLSNSNYQIFQKAIIFKKKKYIQSAYTFRGIVYVKRTANDEAIGIEHIDVLDGFRRYSEQVEIS